MYRDVFYEQTNDENEYLCNITYVVTFREGKTTRVLSLYLT
jgi:hypothetical protein